MSFKIKLRRIPRRHLHEMIKAQQSTLNEMAEVMQEHEAMANSPLVHLKRFFRAVFRRKR